jgi:Uma2 family endonuclease
MIEGMATDAVERNVTTVAEYLAIDRGSAIKHEFLDGEIFSMTGASLSHNIIVANLIGELRQATRHRPCTVFASDARVKTPSGLFCYPDVTALCGQIDRSDEDQNTLTNPQLIIEVLSDSTEGYDRGKKFRHYRSIPSLVDFVLVSQTERQVEHFSHREDGTWIFSTHKNQEKLTLPSLDCEIHLDEIYLKAFDLGE